MTKANKERMIRILTEWGIPPTKVAIIELEALLKQADRSIEMLEEMKKNPDAEILKQKGIARLSESYLSAALEAVKFKAYNQAISDCQKAIKKDI